MPFIDHLKSRVKPIQKRIVLPENNSDRALKAAAIVAREGFAKIILVGDPEQLNRDAKRLGVSFEGIEIINPATYERMDELCAYFAKRREKKGMTVDKAREIMTKDTTFFGAGLVAMGDADGCVSGSTRTSADVIKAGLQVIGVRPGNKTVCSGVLIVPAATARNFARSAGGMFWWALLVGTSSAFVGLALSAQKVIQKFVLE